MYNSFDNCKNEIKENMNKNSFSCGMSLDELKVSLNQVKEKYKNESISKIKAELIAFILGNAGIDICDGDIFAFRINHGDFMIDFLNANKSNPECAKITESIKNYNETKTFYADMDFGHIAPDWQYVLDKGISGIIGDLEEESKKHTEKGKNAYYNDRIYVYNAIKKFFLRYSELALETGGKKGQFIADNLRFLAENPPATLAQAMQLMLMIYIIQTKLDTVIVRSLGGLDRMFYPFYKSDLESGRYKREELEEILKYFYFDISCMKVTANMPFYICGVDENGNDTSNEFTFILLDVYRQLDIYDPKIHIMYHENINRDIVNIVLEMIREGKNSFVFMNTKLASDALEAIGVSSDDAKRVIVYGCYEPAAEGTEIAATCGGMVNLVKAVENVLYSGKNFDMFEAFYDAVVNEIISYTKLCMDTIAAYEPNYKNVCPSLIMSPTFKDSRENGIDVYEGGARYNNTSIVGVGLATLVDSLVVIKRVVFEGKLKTLDELKEILLSNWEKDEKLRLTVKNRYAKFGNNNKEADSLATDIYEQFANVINGKKNGRGGVFRCGMFSVDWRYFMGRKTGATPDGRKSGEPLAKNLAASLGQDKKGVTSYLNSLLKLDGKKCPDGYVADVVLHSSAVQGEDGMAAFKGLLDTFMKNGGFSVHFNVLNKETLINAQKEPDKYRNLQIRLCGWNVLFVDLNKEQQDEFIKQSEATF